MGKQFFKFVIVILLFFHIRFFETVFIPGRFSYWSWQPVMKKFHAQINENLSCMPDYKPF